MSQPSSSTSSSERPLTRRRAALIVLWTLLGLALIDVGVNVAFAYPSDPKITSVGQLPAYFEYGRSIEGKLDRITRADPSETAPITLVGWYEPLRSDAIGGAPGGPMVSFYGMSHSVRLSQALVRTTHRYQSRSVGAPGATANWAFGAFLRDRDRKQSKVAVLSIMSLNAPMVATMTAMTWNSAFPMPYTTDRFVLAGNGLRTVRLPYESFGSFTRLFYNETAWAGVRQQFERFDAYYDTFLFRRSILDRSATLRLVRRAYGLHLERNARARVMDDRGFHGGTEEIRLLNGIVRAFAQQARSDGIVPVIFVINNYGYGAHLYDALKDTLATCEIPYLSSHTIVSPSDPRNYLPDTHFTDTNDDRLAMALEQVVDAQLARGRTAFQPAARCPPSPVARDTAVSS
jgi:hypothetical protein